MKIWLNAKQHKPSSEGFYFVSSVDDPAFMWLAYWDNEKWAYPEGHDEKEWPVTHWADIGGHILSSKKYSNIIDD